MADNELKERNEYISKLKAMGFNYKWDKYETKQLKMIYIKSMDARKAICKEIASLGNKVGTPFNITNLYHSNRNIDQLRGIKTRLYKDYNRLLIVQRIEDLAKFLDKDFNFLVENMFQGHKTTEDLEDVLFKLEKELHDLELEALQKKDTIHYDKDYALGDDPMLDQISREIIIPKEKVIEIVNTLDKLKRRRKNKSLYLDKIPKKKYDRIMSKYHNLEENYSKLTSDDFEWLINVYNQAINSLTREYEEIDEQVYTKHI